MNASKERGNEAKEHHLDQLSTQQTHAHDPTPDVPDGGYGWVCVGTCFSINAFTWGIISVSHSI
jgi:hypothetical protein